MAKQKDKEELQKSPLGLEPRWLVAEKRLMEISEAIKRYSISDKQIPEEWLEEKNDLEFYMENRITKHRALNVPSIRNDLQPIVTLVEVMQKEEILTKNQEIADIISGLHAQSLKSIGSIAKKLAFIKA